MHNTPPLTLASPAAVGRQWYNNGTEPRCLAVGAAAQAILVMCSVLKYRQFSDDSLHPSLNRIQSGFTQYRVRRH